MAYVPPFALALSLGLVGRRWGGSARSAPSVPPQPVRIMPLGDSMTLGWSVPGGYRLPLRSLLAPRLPFAFVGGATENSEGLDQPRHEGHPGWGLRDFIGEAGPTPAEGPAPITTFVRAASPDVIMLLVGANDREAEEAEFERRYRVLLDGVYAVRPDVRIALMEPPPTVAGDMVHVARAREAAVAITGECRARGKRIVLINPRGRFDQWTMLLDWQHPNALGYRAVAEMHETAIETLMGLARSPAHQKGPEALLSADPPPPLG